MKASKKRSTLCNQHRFEIVVAMIAKKLDEVRIQSKQGTERK